MSPNTNSISLTVLEENVDKKASPPSKTKRTYYVAFAGVCLLGLAVGLGVGLGGGGGNGVKKGGSEQTKDESSHTTPSPPFKGIRSYSESMMEGYAACTDLMSDLEEAGRVMADMYVDRMALQYYHGQNFYGVARGGGRGMPMPINDMIAVPEMAPTAGATVGGNNNKGGESSYGTNNQVDGVDEADVVKSDGDYVYAAYGDTLVVWDARSGVEVSRIVIPTEDDEGTSVCEEGGNLLDPFKEIDEPCYPTLTYPTRMEVASLLLHKNRLAVIVKSPEYPMPIVPFIMEEESKPIGKKKSPILQGYRTSRIFVYDTSNIGSASDQTLRLVKRKDLPGYYKAARSLERHVHVVTSSGINLYDTIYNELHPTYFVPDESHPSVLPGNHNNFNPEDLPEEDYRRLAKEQISTKISDFAQRLAHDVLGTDVPTEGLCQRMVKLALFNKPYQEDESNNGTAPFTETNVLSNFAQVTSFDLLDDDDFDTADTTLSSTITQRLLSTQSSGMFVPLNTYTSSIYASTSKLVLAGEAYEEDEDGNWKEKTLLFAFHLDGASSTPQSMGEVPGSLLNQFSMDHFTSDDNEDYLRVATTSWARWSTVDDVWTQTEESTSQVTVLQLTSSDDSSSATTSTMPIVGQVKNLGRDERIYAVRFLGERGFVVTFRQIDPFYTLDLSDPTEPKVMGELKIPGFSNYLHPIKDSDLILAVGQDADETTGRQQGLQIALYDVSDMSDPQQVKKYTEGSADNNGGSYSAAQYDHQAFRYLEQTEVLILPVTRYGRNEFDGFVVYNVHPRDTTIKMGRRMEISHKFNPNTNNDNVMTMVDYCWSYNRLTPRSMVFDGNVMTMKGHTVLSHDLDSANDEEELWMLNLDAKKPENKMDCRGWW